jgi:hypothetical protein
MLEINGKVIVRSLRVEYSGIIWIVAMADAACKSSMSLIIEGRRDVSSNIRVALVAEAHITD